MDLTRPTLNGKAMRRFGALAVLVIVSCAMTMPAMAAADGRDIIGPHEYDLPVNFKPFNVFVQYIDFGNSGSSWNSMGNRVDGRPTQTFVGLTKFLHAWTPSWAPNMGMGFEVIAIPESVRQPPHGGLPGTSVSGFGDPLVGPAFWWDPVQKDHVKVTVGFDFLPQVPVGNSIVGGGLQWHLNSAFFYNVDYYKWNITGDVGTIAPLSSSTATGRSDGTQFYTDEVLSYQVTPHFAPFIGTTYVTVGTTRDRSGSVITSRGHETLASVGLYIPVSATNTFTFRYSRGVDGKNHGATNEFGFRWIYVF